MCNSTRTVRRYLATTKSRQKAKLNKRGRRAYQKSLRALAKSKKV